MIVMSLINVPDLPDLGSDFDDKILHVIAYFLLTILWITYFKPLDNPSIFVKILILAICLGALLEVLQLILNPNRTFDILDILSNTIGSSLGTFIAVRFTLLKLK